MMLIGFFVVWFILAWFILIIATKRWKRNIMDDSNWYVVLLSQTPDLRDHRSE